MQTMMIYTVRDEAADGYLQPFFMLNDAMATRAFQSLVREPGHNFHASPQDFSLWRVGQFDGGTGEIVPVTPVQVCKALSLATPTSYTPNFTVGE